MVNGAKLIDCRKKSGFKAYEIAQKIGVKRQALYQYEREQRTPSVKRLEKLADLYGISINELLKKD